MDTDSAPAASTRFMNTVLFNDRGLRAGWRLAIYCGIVFFLRLLAFQILFLFVSKDRILTMSEMTPGFTIGGDGLFFLFLLLAALIMARIERRAIGEYGLALNRGFFRRFLIGYIFWGFVPLTVCLAAIHLLHGFNFGTLALHGREIFVFGALWAVAFILVGLAEEYLLRGYALYTLADGIGFWPAAIVLGVLFGLGHAGNPGESRIGLMGTVVFALFAALTLRLTGNLWLAVGAHAGWDWGQSFFYGVSDSGLSARGHLLQPSFSGPVWLTGGTVGPEGSVITLVLWSLMILVFAIIYRRPRPALVVVAETKT